MGKSVTTKGTEKVSTLPKTQPRIVSFEKKGNKKWKKNFSDRNRKAKIDKYHSDSEDDKESENVADKDKKPKINKDTKGVKGKKRPQVNGDSDTSEDSEELNDEFLESPPKKQHKKIRKEVISNDNVEPAESESSGDQDSSGDQEPSSDQESDDRDSSSDTSEEDLPIGDNEKSTKTEPKKRSFADAVAGILEAEVPTDKQGNVKLLSAMPTPDIPKEALERHAAYLARRERETKAHLSKLRRNKNHIVPDITTGATLERQLRKLATKGVVRLFNALSEFHAPSNTFGTIKRGVPTKREYGSEWLARINEKRDKGEKVVEENLRLGNFKEEPKD